MTHPVNNTMSGAGSAFFTTLAGQRTGNWTELRNARELSPRRHCLLRHAEPISIAMAASLIGRES